MTSTATDSDALAIARFCWPEQTWEPFRDSTEAHAVNELGECAGPHFSGRTRAGLALAECALVERGHAEAYGRALVKEIRWDGPELPAETPSGAVLFGWYAHLATAPLDARVRAMAAVIRSLPA